MASFMPSPQHINRIFKTTGFVFASVGLVILIVIIALHGDGILAGHNLSNLNFPNVDETATLTRTTTNNISGKYFQSNLDDTVENYAIPLTYVSLYPGVKIHPKYWSESLWAGEDTNWIQEDTLPEGFQPLSVNNYVSSPITETRAQHIRIPSIGVDSPVNELKIINLNNSSSYETPNNVVGHIPETSNPGELGNGWFFGHLESPVMGEGNVFGKLPQIPDYLRNGDTVYIMIDVGNKEYIYQATSSSVIHKDELHLFSSDDSRITLVTCVPRLVYDHRLLISAILIGVKN